ncbi:MAG: hypothetical protein R3C68_16410, partial [Myxococcota bacterium]
QKHTITYVFARLTDWLAFYEEGEADKLRALKFFGNTRLLHTMTDLWAQQNSVVSLRYGATI